jgi:putative phage-type endonuclease
VDAGDQTIRRTGIGGSDAAAILGLNPYQTRYAVAVEKIHGVRPPEDAESRERMDWGKKLEPLLRGTFMERTGLYVEAGGSFTRHVERPYLFANVDGLIDRNMLTHPTAIVPPEIVELGGDRGVFEGKCAGGFDMSDWGDDRDLLIPVSYWVQGQHYLAVTGRAWCGFGCLLNGNRFIVRWCLRDDEFIEGRLYPELDKFWGEVERREVADPVDPFIDEQILRLLHREVKGSIVELSDEQTRAVYRWSAAHEQRASTERQEKALKLAVQAAMGTASIGKLTTGEQITYQTDKAGRRLLRAPHQPPARKR